MSEQEYIDATNLAKVRMATTILRDYLAMTADEIQEMQAITGPLWKIQDRLFAKIETARDAQAVAEAMRK